jgi:hypothetical protein
MTSNVREILAHLPGEVATNVNLPALDQVIEKARVTGTPDDAVNTVQSIIEQADAIFHDPVYRALAVKLFTLILNVFAK